MYTAKASNIVSFLPRQEIDDEGRHDHQGGQGQGDRHLGDEVPNGHFLAPEDVGVVFVELALKLAAFALVLRLADVILHQALVEEVHLELVPALEGLDLSFLDTGAGAGFEHHHLALLDHMYILPRVAGDVNNFL